MKPGIRDEVEGKLHNLKGKVKEKVAELTNDPDLETEGEAEEIAGKMGDIFLRGVMDGAKGRK